MEIHNFATTVNNTHTQLELIVRTNAGEPAARARRAVRQGAGAWAIAAGREGVRVPRRLAAIWQNRSNAEGEGR